MVKVAGQQLMEEVMSITSPALIKFVKSDHCAVLDKDKIGVLITIPKEKAELSPIKEEEVRSEILILSFTKNL